MNWREPEAVKAAPPELILIAVLTGAVTVTVISSSSVNTGVPLSVTLTVNVKVPVAVGVQVKTPVVALIAAPAGAPTNEKAFVWPVFTSVAVAVKVSAWFVVTALFPIAASTGASLIIGTISIADILGMLAVP